MSREEGRPSKQVYRIDGQDRIRSADGFLIQGRPASKSVIGRSLWDFVSNPTIVSIYRNMVRRAREGHPIRFRYRCDAPDARRLYRMIIHPLPDGLVEFATELVREEIRPRVALLDLSAVPRSKEFVRVCSWCERVALPDGQWVPVERAVVALGLMQQEVMPQLTHGICERCFARVRRGLERGSGGRAA